MQIEGKQDKRRRGTTCNTNPDEEHRYKQKQVKEEIETLT